MREHPLRRQVVGEMHLRRWPQINAHTMIVQTIRVIDETDREAELACLLALPEIARVEAANDQHRSGWLAKQISFTWERHSECSSLTLFIDVDDTSAFLQPHAMPDFDRVLNWAENLPGQVIRATRIWIARDEPEATQLLPHAGFLESDLVSCHIGGGARMWSDFRLRPDGYGYLILAVNDLPPGDISRLVQRLQELGNYRNLALLGLPVAQSFWPRLNEAEEKLRRLGEQVINADVRDDTLMDRTSSLSLELVSIATAANYRMSATSAYARLAEERLHDLDVQPIPGFPSLIDFTQRRFSPAVRTCAALTDRERQLSERAARFTSLLRTRIETRIENQNARLLASMEHSSGRQLRLQQLVEGLSVVALSYYGLGIMGYVFKGLEEIRPGFHAALATALTAPVVVVAMWAMIRHLKNRLLR